ncbi:MAG: hypothetical protein D6731_12165, partial [Planctomycetota bacterium]
PPPARGDPSSRPLSETRSYRAARPGSDRYVARAAEEAPAPPPPAPRTGSGPARERSGPFASAEEGTAEPRLFGEDPDALDLAELFAEEEEDPHRTLRFEAVDFESEGGAEPERGVPAEPAAGDPPGPGELGSELGPGTLVAGFEIQELLGEGGMGRVYKALQRSLDRHVALKVLTPALAADESFSRRLESEAKAAARLRHPNVVGVIEQGTCPRTGVKFVAFEFVDGKTAEDLVAEQGRLPERDALTICLGVAEALSCAEEARIVHRDVKPENILIGRDGIPRLADLGLARRQGDDPSSETRHGLFLGTPHFAAPEQALGVEEIDVRADLYSLGICLWRLVTGRVPFEAPTPIAILTRHINEDVPDPRTVAPEVSEGVALLVRYLSARDREDRYPTARDAAQSIRRVLEGKPPSTPRASGRLIGKRSGSGVRTGPVALGASADAAPPAEQPSRRAFRGRGFFDDIPRAEEVAPTSGSGVRVFRGRGFYDDPELLAPDAGAPVEESPQDESSCSDLLPGLRRLLDRDGERAYRVRRRLGEGPRALVYEAEVDGERSFPGYAAPLERVVIKVAKDGCDFAREHELLSLPDPRLVRLLGSGELSDGAPYIVLERLYENPALRAGSTDALERVDAATATELFVNLLEGLKGLHFRRQLPLILGSIAPRSVMLRLPPGRANAARYEQLVRAGDYEPVFVDVHLATDKRNLPAEGAARNAAAATADPRYLAPELLPAGEEGGPQAGALSERADVYALCLTYHALLTGVEPYVEEGLDELPPAERLQQLRFLKRKRSPVDEERVRASAGREADAVLDLLRLGLAPDPQERPAAGALLLRCKRTFALSEARPRTRPEEHRYATPSLRLRQRVFGRRGRR